MNKIDEWTKCYDTLMNKNCVSYLLIAITRENDLLIPHYYFENELEIPAILEIAIDDLSFRKKAVGKREEEDDDDDD